MNEKELLAEIYQTLTIIQECGQDYHQAVFAGYLLNIFKKHNYQGERNYE